MAQRVALVAGATGLVGQAVLAELLADEAVSAVHCIGRRAPLQTHPRLHFHPVDLGAALHLQALGRIDEAYIALGTTIRQAGSEAAFRSLDFDAVLAVAQAAQAQGAMKLGVVSAMGANSRSRIFYNRVKGEMEAALATLGYATLVIVRPSLLDGQREALGQATRPGEKWGLRVLRLMGPLIPPDYRGIRAEQVGRALVAAVCSRGPGLHILPSAALQRH